MSTFLSCNNNANNKNLVKQKEKIMVLSENQEIIDISKRLREGMINFIEPGVTSYTEKDVQKCMNILTLYLNEIEITNSKDVAMKIVEKTVLSLNELNENCGYELIETGQREDIAEIIKKPGSLKGYNTRGEDITEEWREW
jgi:hypothetical protein